jgi:hypothetical protein
MCFPFSSKRRMAVYILLSSQGIELLRTNGTFFDHLLIYVKKRLQIEYLKAFFAISVLFAFIIILITKEDLVATILQTDHLTSQTSD